MLVDVRVTTIVVSEQAASLTTTEYVPAHKPLALEVVEAGGVQV
jgi:hypothetical protein